MAELTQQYQLPDQVPVVSGKLLYYAFMAGGRRVLQAQSEINHINVFPVNDKDTGTNMASTVRWVMDHVQPDKSYKNTVMQIAEAALTGARGNSGVIFAQFLHGLSRETLNKPMLTLTEFAESVKKSIPYIYEAIAHPVEGTMLTVIKEWSEFLQNRKHDIHDFKKVFTDSLLTLEEALQKTTSQLESLKKSGFVDAGAKGFVEFVHGIIHLLEQGDFRALVTESEPVQILHHEDPHNDEITFRYCTEAILKNLSVTKEQLQHVLEKSGDSIVVAGSSDLCRIHVHTSEPAPLFNTLSKLGTVSYQKADDMIRQQELVNSRKWNIALVCDSTCDLSAELLDHYQVNTVPLNLYFGENHFLDKVTIHPEQFYDLLDTDDHFPKTAQINAQTFTNLYSHLSSHYDAVIAIHLSSEFSGTYNSSVKAAKRIADEFGKPIHVINSKSLSGALGLLVLKAAQHIEQGMGVDEIVKTIKEDVNRAKIFVSVQNLKSMIRGGRVSKPKGFIASALGLNPVISVDENGKSILFGKTFSQKASLNKIYKHIRKISHKKNIWGYVVLHAHNPELAKEVEDQMHTVFEMSPVSVVNIAPAIGMHAGIGSVAVAVLYNP